MGLQSINVQGVRKRKREKRGKGMMLNGQEKKKRRGMRV